MADLTVDNRPPSISTDDESDIGIRRQFRAMKSRLAELEGVAARFADRVPTATSLLRQPIGQRCGFHLHVVVYEHSKRVECADCKEPLDPLDVLRQFARAERSFADTLDHLLKQRTDLNREIEALKKQKQSLRNAVRKAGGKPIERWQIKEPG